MLFNSSAFIFAFLPITFFVYFAFNSRRWVAAGRFWLVFCSLFFYSYWNPIYLPLILASMAVNYFLGGALKPGKSNDFVLLRPFSAARRKQVILGIGVAFNLSVLGYFKYADFFISNLNHLGADLDLLGIALPLAISFFTFQQIAYLVDSFRGETQEYRFINYALFVTFFPQLIAGPIVHHKEMMPQFASTRLLVMNYKNIALGLFIFSLGLFKKVVIADSFAVWADAGFSSAVPLVFVEAWTTSLSYTFQLYFDFSGYTDMAIGAALLFNIRLPINFNSPYKSLDIQDFWRRWHITLGRFLKDYIYIPLGGNRKGKTRTYINLFVTFLLAGLWHGASWMFVLWGALHGMALVIHRFWKGLGLSLPALAAWLVTFNFVNLAWVFFRAPDLATATNVISGMFGLNGFGGVGYEHFTTAQLAWLGTIPDALSGTQLILLTNAIPLFASVLALVLIFQRNTIQLARERLTMIRISLASLFFSIAVMMMVNSVSNVFLYFNF
ncbi:MULTISPECIES: MBOAT family protein [Marichromatium]|uniref:Probable alginate O-acetylase n=1 Tax=Marichromatium gracile TaxID=1048 RepID=A0A4V2WAL1_MARGR|nr:MULTISPECIES: MBOAT family protein [Marichromatium]MBK1707692.1 membrane-bound O-acyltransferase family protein [Marichromatium gracile]RNE92191.1 MBOAT family protein [Marichromatium sp. AB31]TCW39680.1 D-alanyl-lipoteichoic acid acyltransferase DltB (MBOAT superfamily) [Marichromatium gracile]